MMFAVGADGSGVEAVVETVCGPSVAVVAVDAVFVGEEHEVVVEDADIPCLAALAESQLAEIVDEVVA